MSDTSVRDLLDRVRNGDSSAAEELVRTYEPEIRRAIRVRMTDARLRRLVDSIDICQSVLAGFFVRTAAGQYDIQTPEELLRLLVTMARNRIIDWARRQQADVAIHAGKCPLTMTRMRCPLRLRILDRLPSW